MCFPAKTEQAQAFAVELARRLPGEVQQARVVRTGRENPWFPDTDVEVHVVAAGDPEELRPKVAQIVAETMWRDDVWVEVRVEEVPMVLGDPPDERLALRA
jgi:hypothetical protein